MSEHLLIIIRPGAVVEIWKDIHVGEIFRYCTIEHVYLFYATKWKCVFLTNAVSSQQQYKAVVKKYDELNQSPYLSHRSDCLDSALKASLAVPEWQSPSSLISSLLPCKVRIVNNAYVLVMCFTKVRC